MEIITLIILILATHRIAILLAEEGGPLEVVSGLRRLIGVRLSSSGDVYVVKTRGGWVIESFANGILCPFCNSIWVGCVFTLIVWLSLDLPVYQVLALPFALSSCTVIIERSI